MKNQLADWLGMLNLPASPLVINSILLTGLLLVGYLVDYTTRHYLNRSLAALIRKSRVTWDDLFLEQGVIRHACHLITPVLVMQLAPNMLEDTPALLAGLLTVTSLYLIYVVIRILLAVIRTIEITAGRRADANRLPIRSMAQLAKLFVLIIAFIVTIAVLLDESPVFLLSGLGAFTAVLLLVFKDTILGFVGGLQLAANDMVRNGDWIEMPKYGADGDVIEVGLTSVKVRNWDKTVTTIPTYALISDAFKNWRGMAETGARRIKRCIFIDTNSIRFLHAEEIDDLCQTRPLADYLASKRDELAAQPKLHQIDTRRLTNIGTFRAYLEHYLRAHPQIREDMTLLVRQLQPTDKGLPIELYCFCRDTRWAHYESVQADLFDHIYATLPAFSLRAYQAPSGLDFNHWSSAVAGSTATQD